MGHRSAPTYRHLALAVNVAKPEASIN